MTEGQGVRPCFVCEGTGSVYADEVHTGPAMRCGHCGGTGQLTEGQVVAGQGARLTADELAAIRARCEAATSGPWRAIEPINRAKHNYRMVVAYAAEEDKPGGDDPWGWIADLGNSSYGLADAEFIAHAREDVPALLADRDALTVENERLAAALENAAHWLEPQPDKPFAGILEARRVISATLTKRADGGV